MEPATYEIRRDWVWAGRLLGAVLALGSIGCIGLHVHDPEDMPLGLAVIGSGLTGGLAWLCLHLGHRSETYAIEITDEGVRGIATSVWAPWSGIVSLRERPFLNRIDLIGPSGPTGISLEYQLDAFDDALERVMEHVHLEQTPSSTFGRPLFSSATFPTLAVVVAMVGLGIWVWVAEGEASGLGLVAVMLAALGSELLTGIRRVTIADGMLTLHRGLRVQQHPLHEIASVRLDLRSVGNGNQSLDVFVVRMDEMDPIPIRPPGADAFALYVSLRDAIGPRSR